MNIEVFMQNILVHKMSIFHQFILFDSVNLIIEAFNPDRAVFFTCQILLIFIFQLKVKASY